VSYNIHVYTVDPVYWGHLKIDQSNHCIKKNLHGYSRSVYWGLLGLTWHKYPIFVETYSI